VKKEQGQLKENLTKKGELVGYTNRRFQATCQQEQGDGARGHVQERKGESQGMKFGHRWQAFAQRTVGGRDSIKTSLRLIAKDGGCLRPHHTRRKEDNHLPKKTEGET